MSTTPKLDAVCSRLNEGVSLIIDLEVYPPLPGLAETREKLLRALETNTLTKDELENALASLPEEGVPIELVLETLRSKVSSDALEALRVSLTDKPVTREHLEELVVRHLFLNARGQLETLLA